MSLADSRIETATVELAEDGPRRCAGYLATPGGAPAPAVLVLHDMFGLNAPIRDFANQCAHRGFPALVPNLFWRSANPGDIPYDDGRHVEAWERLKALDLDAASADMRLAARWLRGQRFCNGKVAAVGFCGGGRLAYLAAARAGVDGAASLYGLGISSHLDELPRVGCPLQLHYGLRDQHVPQQEVDAVTAGVRGHPGVDIYLYAAAGHSFANPVRPTFDAAAAALAFDRIGAMLTRLRTGA